LRPAASRAAWRVGRPPAGAEGPTLTLAFVGDINLDGLPGDLVRHGGDPFAAFAALLDGADIRVGNLECVVATRG
jgi:poly-gamma-glutamate synthesis protein (capsule biosynthesis protein)